MAEIPERWREWNDKANPASPVGIAIKEISELEARIRELEQAREVARNLNVYTWNNFLTEKDRANRTEAQLQALTQERDQLQARVRELEQDLQVYGDHTSFCLNWKQRTWSCVCGWDEYLAALNATDKAVNS